ncbi:hypothetical protein QFC21_001434 [Naganishia friedmannii]|uniref:Uncharacterized protein n=1 Tax=Naganishia friedmannii TaxID=89922 RepID=A0ACC2W521_9TREE|nr:hypothetical protein QFC21_001434 [Naganishia friedmannii]
MSALSEKEKLQREIAKLSATINRSSSTAASRTYPVKQRHTPTPYIHKAPYARNNAAQMAGGRHRSLVLDNRNGQGATSSATTSKTSMTLPATNGTIGRASAANAASGPSSQQVTTNGTSASTATRAPIASASTRAGDAKMVYVNRTTKKGNMSMVKPELYGKLQVFPRAYEFPAYRAHTICHLHSDSEKARLNRSVKTASEKASKAAAGKRSHMERRSYSSQLSSANGGTSVAKRVVIDGVTYEFEADGVTLRKVEVWTSDAPLARADALPTKQRKRKLDNRDGSQSDGDDCLYPHVKVADDAPVCVAFSTEGWCDKGSTCEERHAWECREYSEKGVCSRGAKCGLAHVLKAKMPATVADTSPLDLSDDDSSVHGTKANPDQQPDDVEPSLSGIPPVSEKTIELEQQLAQDKVLHESKGISTGNDFERQEDFIQFADIGEDEDEDEGDVDEDGTEEDASEEDAAMSSGVEGEDDQRIKYTFGESSEERSENDEDELES